MTWRLATFAAVSSSTGNKFEGLLQLTFRFSSEGYSMHFADFEAFCLIDGVRLVENAVQESQLFIMMMVMVILIVG